MQPLSSVVYNVKDDHGKWLNSINLLLIHSKSIPTDMYPK